MPDRGRDLPRVPSSFTWTTRSWGRALECVPLAAVAAHGWTTRDLALEGSEAACESSLRALAEGEGVAPDALAAVRQVHGARVVSARETGAEADALVSADSARLLTIRVADCVALLLADRRTGAVAAVHAGWRGTAAGIAGAAVARMRGEHGTAPGDVVAAIGPSIRACCYEVGGDVRAAFLESGAPGQQVAAWFSPGRGDRLQLDVARANVDQLVAAGVPSAQIHDAGLCTACAPNFFYSYRRDGRRAGRLVGFIRSRR